MKRSRAAGLAAIALITALVVIGCNRGVLYYGDATTKMEETRHDYVRNNPGNRFNEDILAGRVHAGMSQLQVRVAWGEPDHLSRGDRAGIDQLWTYEEDEPSRGESFFQMRFYQGVLREISMTRGSPQLTAKGPRDEVYNDNPVHPQGATLTPLK